MDVSWRLFDPSFQSFCLCFFIVIVTVIFLFFFVYILSPFVVSLFPGGCTCSDVSDECIMSAVSSFPQPVAWSSCSEDDITSGFTNFNLDRCLQNTPAVTVGDPICGNGIREQDEVCDCGSIQVGAQLASRPWSITCTLCAHNSSLEGAMCGVFLHHTYVR